MGWIVEPQFKKAYHCLCGFVVVVGASDKVAARVRCPHCGRMARLAGPIKEAAREKMIRGANADIVVRHHKKLISKLCMLEHLAITLGVELNNKKNQGGDDV